MRGQGNRDLPRFAFARASSTPPAGSIQFYDGYFPALEAGKYSLRLEQSVTGPEAVPPYSKAQEFEVVASEFSIDPDLVHTAYPPTGTAGVYDRRLPFVVLGDPSLPWERGIEPGGGAPDSSDPVPWMALAVFAEGEIELQPGSSNPVETTSVEKLLEAEPEVLKPHITGLPPEVLASQCQAIKVTGPAFSTAMPAKPDLRYLAHCRAVSHPDEGELLLSVLLANRLPLAAEGPARFHAHLVSVEGFQDYLGPGAKPVPGHVQLVSLFNWTFVSQPERGQSFKQLVEGLIEHEQATPALRLPPASGPKIPPAAAERLEQGYAPLPFVTGAGSSSFAWYRGPFTPVVAQPLPTVGEPPIAASEATSADQLMIYLAEQGLFDLSYAAAWNLGRQLALADASFAQAMSRYRREAGGALARLAQGMAAPHLAGTADPAELLAPRPTRSRFLERVGEGLGSRWTGSLAAAREEERPAPGQAHRVRPPRLRQAPHPATVLEQPGAVETLADHLEEAADPVAAWLAKLSRLGSVPFSHLVPDPLMLPPESIRFFYVDQGWIDALLAGATSLAIHATADVALLSALRPRLEAAVRAQEPALASGSGATGMLIRSALVPGWPGLAVRATVGGDPLTILRDDCPSPSVRLCLFEGVPDEVSLAEPYQGLLFGLEDGDAVAPRNVTSKSAVGAQIANLRSVPAAFRSPGGAAAGVLDVAALAAALETAVGQTAFSAAAVVHWNGTPLATKLLSPGRLEAAVGPELIAGPGTASITVVDGAVSAPAQFTIDEPPAVDSPRPAPAAAGGTKPVESGGTGPSIHSFEQGAASVAGGGFKLVVRGAGFGGDAVVKWNGSALTTTRVDAGEVSAEVPATLLTPGDAAVTVESGGTASPSVPFAVISPQPGIGLLEPSSAVAGGAGFQLTVTGGFGAGDFAIQMVDAPELQTFEPGGGSGA